MWRCLSRAGYKPAWSLLTLIPGLGLVIALLMVGVLAFSPWPAVVGRAESTSWHLLSRTDWVNVTFDEVYKYRYYGLDGWLLLLYGTVVLGIAANIIELFDPTGREHFQIYYGLSLEGAWTLAFNTLFWTITYMVFIPIKRPFIPKLVIASSWLNVVTFVGIVSFFNNPTASARPPAASFAGSETVLFWGLSFGVLITLSSTWYWLKSKRVNATYLNRIPAV